MKSLVQIPIETIHGTKRISVIEGDIVDLDFSLDVLLISAFFRSYAPTPGTMIGALDSRGIYVYELADRPEIDLRRQGNIWLSESIRSAGLPVGRIGCVEFSASPRYASPGQKKTDVPQTIKAFFKMLELATAMGVGIGSLGMTLPGAGRQHISEELVIVPLLNECLSLLKNNDCVNSISIIERNPDRAGRIAAFFHDSYAISQSAARQPEAARQTKRSEDQSALPLAFLSYSKTDKNLADNLCAKLEANGVRAWYAPRDVDASDYATAIVKAISRATHFIVVLTHESLQSQHVLNEVDLAFQELNRGIRFYPLKIAREEMGPSFKYYLSRQHWMDATYPPLEKRLDEFVEKIRSEL